MVTRSKKISYKNLHTKRLMQIPDREVRISSEIWTPRVVNFMLKALGSEFGDLVEVTFERASFLNYIAVVTEGPEGLCFHELPADAWSGPTTEFDGYVPRPNERTIGCVLDSLSSKIRVNVEEIFSFLPEPLPPKEAYRLIRSHLRYEGSDFKSRRDGTNYLWRQYSDPSANY